MATRLRYGLTICILTALFVALRYCLISQDIRNVPTLEQFTPWIESAIRLGESINNLKVIPVQTSLTIMFLYVLLAATLLAFFCGKTLIQRSFHFMLSAIAIFSWALLAVGKYQVAFLLSLTIGVLMLCRFSKMAASEKGPDGAAITLLQQASLMSVILFGLLVRFYSLAQYPPGFSSHAGGHLQAAIDFCERLLPALSKLDFYTIKAFYPVILEQHGPHAFISALGFRLYGISMTSARMNSATVGVLTLVVAYFLGKSLKDRLFGITFAALLASSPWHISISRHGNLEHVLAPFHCLLTLLLLVRTQRKGTPELFFLTGIIVGLSWYVYATNQVMLLLASVYLATIVLRQRISRSQKITGCILFTLGFIAVSYPQLSYYLDTKHYLPVRSTYGNEMYHLVWGRQIFVNLLFALKQLVVQVDDGWFGCTCSALQPIELVFVSAAILYALGGLRNPCSRETSFLALGLIIFGLMPGVLGADAPFRRLILAALGITLVVSNLLASYLRLFSQHAYALWQIIFVGSSLILLFSTSTFTYFKKVGNFESASNRPRTELARFACAPLGIRPVSVFVPTEKYVTMVHEYIRLQCYRSIQQFKHKGLVKRPLYRIVVGRKVSRLFPQIGHRESNELILTERSHLRVLQRHVAHRFGTHSTIMPPLQHLDAQNCEPQPFAVIQVQPKKISCRAKRPSCSKRAYQHPGNPLAPSR